MAKGNTKRGFDADLDTFWKEILDLIEPAVLFFLPHLHAAVDWSEDYQSLEQELRILLSNAKIKVKKTDKLFLLKMKDGNLGYLFLHIEVEAFPRVNFPARVFNYFTHIYLKNNSAPITVLVIFVGDVPKIPLDTFQLEQFGTLLMLQYNTYTVAAQSEEELMASNNLFASLVLANLYVIQSRGNPQKRFELKKKLLEHLNAKGISLDKFKNLLNFALYLVKLTPELEHDFKEIVDNHYHLSTKYMTGKQKLLKHNKELADVIVSAVYRTTVSDLVKKEKEAVRGKEKAEQNLQKTKQKMQKALQKAAQEIERKMQASVLHLYTKTKLSPEQIADALGMKLASVLSIIKTHKI